MGVPNQRIIYINRQMDMQSDYLKLKNESLRKAMRDLDGKGFKLWMYLVDNAQGYKKEMYVVDFVEKSGVSESSYRRAWKDLQDKGYIIQSEKCDSVYMFVEQSGTYNERTKADIVKTVADMEDIIKEFF